MRFTRKPLSVDAVRISVPISMSEEHGQPGDWLVTFEDGSQTIYPADLFDIEFEPLVEKPRLPDLPLRDRDTTLLPNPVPVPPEDWEESKLPTDCTCIECGGTVRREHWDPQSGVGRCCVTVKCPTCRNPAKFSEMAGQYCPRCLPALGNRQR